MPRKLSRAERRARLRRALVGLPLTLAFFSASCSGTKSASDDEGGPLRGGGAGLGTTGGSGGASGPGAQRCTACEGATDCVSGFCNQVASNDLADAIGVDISVYGRCSPPGDEGTCACETGYVANGQVCVGTGCPPGSPVQLCDHLSGDPLSEAGPNGAGGAPSPLAGRGGVVGNAGSGGVGGTVPIGGAVGSGGVAGVGGVPVAGAGGGPPFGGAAGTFGRGGGFGEAGVGGFPGKAGAGGIPGMGGAAGGFGKGGTAGGFGKGGTAGGFGKGGTAGGFGKGGTAGGFGKGGAGPNAGRAGEEIGGEGGGA